MRKAFTQKIIDGPNTNEGWKFFGILGVDSSYVSFYVHRNKIKKLK